MQSQPQMTLENLPTKIMIVEDEPFQMITHVQHLMDLGTPENLVT